eukprot:Opistho-1_new@103039
MVKVHIIYYSMYGHVGALAQAEKKGAESVEGVEVKIFQVKETLSDEILGKMHAPPKPADIPVATPDDLKNADGILFGIPTRFGIMPAQVKALLDSTGGLWQSGALVGKPAGVFFSTATQAGGQETTALSFIPYLVHQGVSFVPLGYSTPLLFNMDEVHGGSPYGAGTFAGPTGARQPSKLELDVAEHQGKLFANYVKALVKGRS